MIKIKSFILCLFFPIVLYGKGILQDTIMIHVNKQVYELMMSVDTVMDGCNSRSSFLHVKHHKERDNSRRKCLSTIR